MPELIEPTLPQLTSPNPTPTAPNPQDLSPTGSSTVPEPPPTTDIIWLDWDDTLLPTKYLMDYGWNLDTDLSTQQPMLIQALLKHEATVHRFLTTALHNCHHLSIITNAEQGWIQLSAAKFMPTVHKLLLAHNVDMCSARSTYEPWHPDAPCKWKYLAMQTRLNSLYRDSDGCPVKPGSFVNVISVGDSHAEREAARGVVYGRHFTWLKTVKFVERPVLVALTAQLDRLGGVLDKLVVQPSSLTINMGVTSS